MVAGWTAGVRTVVVARTRPGGHSGRTTTAAADNNFRRHASTIEHMFDFDPERVGVFRLVVGSVSEPKAARSRRNLDRDPQEGPVLIVREPGTSIER